MRIVFKGVSHTAKVFVDDKYVCEHYNAFTQFEAVVKNQPSGVHKLSGLVDNSFSEASALHVENDFQSYGGISRGVMIEQLPKHYIKQLHFTPVCKDDTWYAQLELVIASLDGKPWKGKVSVSLKGCDDVNENVLYTQSCSTGAGELVLKSDLIACENAKPWAPEHPTLYMLSAQLEDEDGKVIDTSYLMSTMDLCTSDHINEYIEAGVASLKIEGRMKRPEYVAAVTQVYSKAIKHYYENTPNYTKENFNDMKQMFNRHYTSGYPFHADKIVDETFSGNQGVFLGYVKGYDYRSKRVSIALKNDLTQGDSIVFTEIDKGRPVNKIYYQNKLINKAEAGMNVQIEFDDVVKGGTVNKTISVDTINRMQKTYQEEKKYRKIDMSFKASLNKPCTLVVKCDDEEVSVVSEQIIEEASKRAATKENIIDHLNKLGHTVYEADKIDVELYGELFIPITIINNMRREALSKLDALFTFKKHHEAPF